VNAAKAEKTVEMVYG